MGRKYIPVTNKMKVPNLIKIPDHLTKDEALKRCGNL